MRVRNHFSKHKLTILLWMFLGQAIVRELILCGRRQEEIFDEPFVPVSPTTASESHDPETVLDPSQAILDATYSLTKIDIPESLPKKTGPYKGVTATFCKVDWTEQKEKPHNFPRYVNVYKPACTNEKRVEMDLATIVRHARQHDQVANTTVKSLQQSGFVFHESRCGSTLTANMLTVADPSAHRVISEPEAVVTALKSNNKKLVQDVLYMLGRSNDPKEKRVFYKFRSVASQWMHLVPEEVPWIFMYRDPLEVVASQFNPTEYKKKAACASSQKDPFPLTQTVVKERSIRPVEKLSTEEFCAAYLVRPCWQWLFGAQVLRESNHSWNLHSSQASLSLGAIWQHVSASDKGRFVNYNTLPNSLWERILPNHFGIDLQPDGIERMKAITGVYAKGGRNKTREWEEDASKKHELASEKMLKAVRRFMQPYYEQMEEIARTS